MEIPETYQLKLLNWIILTILVIINLAGNPYIFASGKNNGQFDEGKKDSLKYRKIPIHGSIISRDTMPAPKRVLVGEPKVVPFNNFTHIVNSPRVYNIPENLTTIIPGKNSISKPQVYEAQIKTFRYNYPKPEQAREPDLKYNCNGYSKTYSKKHGLGMGKIYTIIQDKNQNICMATNGLIKFDGTSFNKFTHIENNDEKIHLGLSYILEDSKGNLWLVRRFWDNGRILTFDGNEILEISTDDKEIDSKIFNYNFIYEDRNNDFWFGTDVRGVIKYETPDSKYPNGRLIHFTKDCGLPDNQINYITGDRDGNIWIGTKDAGFCKVEMSSSEYPEGRFIHYSIKDGLSNNDVTSILEASNGKLWIGTYGGGINIFDGNSFTYLTVNEGLSNNLINNLYEDKDHNIWIATHGGGVCKFEESTSSKYFGKFTYFNTENLLSSNYILSIMEDARGCMWFGTFGGSLTMYDPNTFHHINTQSGMNIEFVSSPIEDKYGNIWFGDDRGGGICKFDGNTFSYYSREQGLSCDSIACLILDAQDNIWIATTGGGVCKYDGKYFTIYTQNNGLNSNFINCLAEDTRGNIWIGTEHHGISILMDDSIVSYTMEEGLCDDFIYCLYEDRKQNMWIGTEKGGVDKFDGTYITNFNKDNGILHNQLVSVLEDKRGDIWFGVSFRGFFRYNEDATDTSEKFIQLTSNQNYLGKWHQNRYRILNGSGVSFMKEDNEGNLWLANGGGLHLLKIPDNGDLHKMIVYNFSTLDGKSGDNSVFNSPLITRSNRFYWGQGNCLSYLDLNDFNPPSNAPKLQISGIELEQTHIDYKKLSEKIKNGTDYFIGANNDISLNALTFEGVATNTNLPIDLCLPYYVNYLTFHFSAMDWNAPHKLLYQYMLEGSDRDWRKVTKETSAIYSSLKHGNYTFKIKAIGAANKWSEIIEYPFYIRSPWWYSWWAYTLYSIVFLALIIAWRRYDLERQHLKHDLENKRVQTEKLAELDKMKSHFFANISHEFRTPLTLILGPLQSIRSKIKDISISNELAIMNRNAQRLQFLINQLLNLSKLESGKMKLRSHEENVVHFIKLLIQSFESYAVQHNINLLFSSKEKEIFAYIDSEKIEKILNNLLSNAFKFTGQGGKIEVTVNTISHSTVEVTVSDTGKGIPEKLLPHIFERFYQAGSSFARVHEGSGIGLALAKELVEAHHGEISVESTYGQGTIFTIHLPLGKTHLKAEEIANSASSEKNDNTLYFPESGNDEKIKEEINILDLEKATKPLILIVEDNSDLRTYIRGFLVANFQIIEANDGQEGLKKATETIPDLIISDVMMPNMDGYQLCNYLKNNELTNHIPLILLTARASLENKLEGLEIGADDFITKPFEQQELLMRIKNLIRQRKRLKERIKKEIEMETIHPSTLSSLDLQFLEKVKNVVISKMANPEFTVEELATEVGLHRTQLHRKIKALIDQSSSEYIRTLRLNKAAELLLQNLGSISEIAYDVGFNNPSYFSTTFTNQFGISPKKYIEQNS